MPFAYYEKKKVGKRDASSFTCERKGLFRVAVVFSF